MGHGSHGDTHLTAHEVHRLLEVVQQLEDRVSKLEKVLSVTASGVTLGVGSSLISFSTTGVRLQSSTVDIAAVGNLNLSGARVNTP